MDSQVVVMANRGGEWSKRRFTSDVCDILHGIPARASNHGFRAVDRRLLGILILYSTLLGQRKVGVVAIERLGVDRFDLARDLDKLLAACRAGLSPGDLSEGEDLAASPTFSIFEPGHYEVLFEPLIHEAENASNEMGHTWVGTEHFTLAAIRTASLHLSTILRSHALDVEGLTRSIIEVLRIPIG